MRSILDLLSLLTLREILPNYARFWGGDLNILSKV